MSTVYYFVWQKQHTISHTIPASTLLGRLLTRFLNFFTQTQIAKITHNDTNTNYLQGISEGCLLSSIMFVLLNKHLTTLHSNAGFPPALNHSIKWHEKDLKECPSLLPYLVSRLVHPVLVSLILFDFLL